MRHLATSGRSVALLTFAVGVFFAGVAALPASAQHDATPGSDDRDQPRDDLAGPEAIWDWYRSGRTTIGVDLTFGGLALDEPVAGTFDLEGAGYGMIGIRLGTTVFDGALIWGGIAIGGIIPFADRAASRDVSIADGSSSRPEDGEGAMALTLGYDYVLSTSGESAWRFRGTVFGLGGIDSASAYESHSYFATIGLSVDFLSITQDRSQIWAVGIFAEHSSARVRAYVWPDTSPGGAVAIAPTPSTVDLEATTIGVQGALMWIRSNVPIGVVLRIGASDSGMGVTFAFRTGLAF